jgi:hypothetical protein
MRPLGRRGVSLPEALVALVLGLFVVLLGLQSLKRLESARRRLVARTDALVALRVSRHVLRRELRNTMFGEDWIVGGDSLALRAFRGTAIVCGSEPPMGVLVSFTGERAPDPAKDSVLLLGSDGAAEVRALTGVGAASASCAGPDSAGAATWQLDAPAPPGAVLGRLFERGTYHLSGSALRYRRGASGRQPLTPEVWSAAARWTGGAGWVGVELPPRDTLAGRGWSGALAWPAR